MKEEKFDTARIVLNLIGLLIMLACIVVGILMATNVMTNRIVLPLLAIAFIALTFAICFLDYNRGVIDKRRFAMQFVMYFIVLIIAFIYLILVV